MATALRLENHDHSSTVGRSVATASTESKLDCAEIKIVLGAVASSPICAYEAEKMLAGAPLTAERIETAAQLAAKLAKPKDNTDMTLGFRKKNGNTLCGASLERGT